MRFFNKSLLFLWELTVHLCLLDVFFYSYEAEFIQTLIKRGKRQLAKSFSFTFRYIDDVLSLNNSKFSDYIKDIYPEE